MKRLFKALLVQFFWPLVIIMVFVLVIFAYGWWSGNLVAEHAMIATGTTTGLLILFVVFCFRIRIWHFEEEEPMRQRGRRRRRNR